tara:strand:- start:2777 stop:3877 length:1101 start_codon:yes stop_codon:yes gene_type:complete
MYLNKTDIQKLLDKKDLTQEKEHCISLIVDKIKTTLEEKYQIEAEIEKGNPIVSIEDNYYSLGYDSNEITLSERYTKYINQNTILRTQMTSVIPSLLKNYKKDKNKLWLCSGLVYRRDVRDKTHVGEPHQMDIWHLTKEKKTRKDLLSLVESLISIIEKIKNKKIKWRYTETNHHYTDNGIEVEIYHDNKWLELLECGIISQELLNKNNLSEYSGLALGLGLERLVMIIKEIEDIRILYSEKKQIKEQLKDLNKYKQISNQPAISRDMSIAINKEINEEELTEIILNNVNKETEKVIESINIINETKYENLPNVAIERLGMNSSQKNVLLKITIRDLNKTLLSKEANEIYSEIYQIIHQGNNGYLI